MIRSRDLFLEMMERMWNNSWIDDVRMLREAVVPKKDEGSTETLNFRKGNYEHTIHVYFDVNGKYIGTEQSSTYIPTKDEELQNRIMLLKKEKIEAIKSQDFEKAASIRDELKTLETSNIKENQQ